MHYLSKIEQCIIGKLIDSALELGYRICIRDEEGFVLIDSTDKDLISKSIGQTGLTTMIFDKGPTDYTVFVGAIYLVHGNDEDVISDCTDNAEMLALCDSALI